MGAFLRKWIRIRQISRHRSENFKIYTNSMEWEKEKTTEDKYKCIALWVHMKVFSQKILAKIMWCWKWIYLSKINYYKLHTFPWSFNETPRKALRISRVRLWPFAVACTTGTFSFSRYTSPGWIFKWSLPNGINSWGSPAVIIASLPSRFIKIYGNHTSAINNRNCHNIKTSKSFT